MSWETGPAGHPVSELHSLGAGTGWVSNDTHTRLPLSCSSALRFLHYGASHFTCVLQAVTPRGHGPAVSSSSPRFQGQHCGYANSAANEDDLSRGVRVSQRTSFPQGWESEGWGHGVLPVCILDTSVPRVQSPPRDGPSQDQSRLSLLIYEMGP